MPNSITNLTTGTPNLHVDSKTTQTLNSLPNQQQPAPSIDPVSVLQRAVQALSDQVAALQAQSTTLTTQNTSLIAQTASLTSRVTELENATGPMKIVVNATNLALTAASQRADALQAAFAAHTHNLPFQFETWAFFANQPGNVTPLYLMPYLWDGTPDVSEAARVKSAYAQNHTAPPEGTS